MAIQSVSKSAKKVFETIYKLTNSFGEKPETVTFEGDYASCIFSKERGITEIFVANNDHSLLAPEVGADWFFSVPMATLKELKKPNVITDIRRDNGEVIITKIPTMDDPSTRVALKEHSWGNKRKDNPFALVEQLEWAVLDLPDKFDVLKYNFETGNLYRPGEEDTLGPVLYIDSKIVPKPNVREGCYVSIEASDDNFIYPILFTEHEKYKILIRYMKILR